MIICTICNREFEKHKSMTNHRRWHKIPKYEKFQNNFIISESKAKTGIKNPQWKGDKVKYGPLHDYVKRHFAKKKLCEKCNVNLSYDLPNKSGKYLRDLTDWMWLCRKCHMVMDGRIYNLNVTRGVQL